MTFVVVWEGFLGSVILRREKDDGTVVWLACEELPPEARPTGTVAVPQPAGSGPDDGFFPLLARMDRPPLELDIDGLPRGALRFDAEPFARAVVQAQESGVERVTLDFEDAGAWGFRPDHGFGDEPG